MTGYKYVNCDVSQIRNFEFLSQRKKATVVQINHVLKKAAMRFPDVLKGGLQHAYFKANHTVSEIILLYEVRIWVK